MSEKKFTNLDRIRAMSKEQMAELLSGCDIDKAGIKFCGEGGACPHTKECDDGKYPGCVYMDESKSLKEIQREMWSDWLTMEWDDAPELPKMEPRLAVAILRRIQEPEVYEPQLTQKAFDALSLAIAAVERQDDGQDEQT